MSGAPRRILIVDDDEQIRRGVGRILTRAGYATVEAANGQQAIDSYRAAPADLVLTDVYMPGTDGVEAIIRLRSEFPHVRVIAMSGGGHMTAEDVLAMAAKLGAAGTLEKPFPVAALLELVERALGADADSTGNPE